MNQKGGIKMLVEKFREDDLFCPFCHCPQEGSITKAEGDYKCEVCSDTFHYSYNKLNAEYSSFEDK